MSNKNLSLLFTGQGSQYPEMGLDLINEYKWVKDRYSISSDILGYNVLDAQNNPNLLNLTEYSQPSIFIFSSVIIDLLKDKINENYKDINIAGHSLGEYCSLYFANALNFEDMLKVVKSRGEAMSIVSDPNKYSMYAILKKEDQIIDENLFGNGVYIANLNSDKQLVICGLKEKLESFKEKYNLGKYIPLNVSAPFHSELMIESSKIFKEKNLNTNFKKVSSSIISNHKLVNYRDIPETDYLNQLTHQIHSPVMWSKTIQLLISKGIKKFMEIGPKKTLLNFISKDFDGDKISITNKEEVDNYV